MKDRKIEVVVSNAEIYNQLTSSKKKNGDKVKHEVIEAEILSSKNCINLTELQQAILARKLTSKENDLVQTTKEIEEFLSNKNLMEELIKEVQKNVAGERETILTIGLNACGSLVENASKTSYNCIPNDESGTGKDYVTENTLRVFIPEDKLIIRSRMSPKVLNYWHTSKFEPEWTWNGKVLYLKDVSEDVLNSEVMKTFTSDQTKATILINQMAIDLEIKGKPCVFCTTANSTPGQEQLRRFSLIPLDSSKEQTKAIKEFHAKRAVAGNKPNQNEAIVQGMKSLQRVKVAVPYSELIAKKFPDKLIVRTIFGTFIDLIKASAALHQFQREKNSSGFILANFDDYHLARQCLIKITSRGDIVPLTKNQKKLLELIDEELDNNKTPNAGKICKTHNYWAVIQIEEKVNFMNRQNLYSNLAILNANGFLKKGEKEIISTSSTNSVGETKSFSKPVMAYCIQERDEFILPDKKELEFEWMQDKDTKDNKDTKDTDIKTQDFVQF